VDPALFSHFVPRVKNAWRLFAMVAEKPSQEAADKLDVLKRRLACGVHTA
jgi:hypothetical protein